MLGLVVFVLSLVVPEVSTFMRGAPATLCDRMVPAHNGIRPQVSTAPYFFTLSRNTFSPAVTIQGTFQGNQNTPFRGFLIVAKNRDGQIVGTMTAASMNTIILNCTGSQINYNAGLTHSNNADRAGINFEWRAPNDLSVGDVVFYATSVRTYGVYWLNVMSPAITPQLPTTTTTTPVPPPVTSPVTTRPVRTTTTPQAVTTTTTAPTTGQTTQSTTQVPGSLVMDSRCGLDMGCFVKCNGGQCDYIVSWKDAPNHIEFEISAKLQDHSNQWVAIAFSNDLLMGDDEVLECVSDGSDIDVRRSVNDGKWNKPPTDNPDSKYGISEASGSFNNGIFTCKFRRTKKDLTVRTKRAVPSSLLDLTQDWFLMFGFGPASPGFKKDMHRTNPVVTPGRVDLQSLQVIGDTAKYPLIKIHAILMIIAWVFCTGVGIVAARYYKPVWQTESILSQKIWFQIHRTLMVTTFVLTITGFIIIFVQVQGYSQIPSIPGKEFLQTHPPLGIIVTILVIVNPIMSIFRPGPKDYNRPIFNWAHWGVGMVAHILAIITICFGIEMKKTSTPKYAVWVVVGYVVYQILLEITLKTYDICVDRPDTSMNGQVDAIAMTPTDSNGSTATTNGAQHKMPPPPPYTGPKDFHRKDPRDTIVKKLLLGFHAAIALAFTVTLCLLVAMN